MMFVEAALDQVELDQAHLHYHLAHLQVEAEEPLVVENQEEQQVQVEVEQVEEIQVVLIPLLKELLDQQEQQTLVVEVEQVFVELLEQQVVQEL